MSERYYKLVNRVHERHESAPWIYSAIWKEMALAEIEDAFSNENLDQIEALEKEIL